jgi:hypothetical protein
VTIYIVKVGSADEVHNLEVLAAPYRGHSLILWYQMFSPTSCKTTIVLRNIFVLKN